MEVLSRLPVDDSTLVAVVTVIATGGQEECQTLQVPGGSITFERVGGKKDPYFDVTMTAGGTGDCQ
jgi:hypothetical protein